MFGVLNAGFFGLGLRDMGLRFSAEDLVHVARHYNRLQDDQLSSVHRRHSQSYRTLHDRLPANSTLCASCLGREEAAPCLDVSRCRIFLFEVMCFLICPSLTHELRENSDVCMRCSKVLAQSVESTESCLPCRASSKTWPCSRQQTLAP